MRSRENRPPTRWDRRGAAYGIRYLRVVATVDVLGAVWVSLGDDIRRHSTEELFTPYLVTPGFASGAFAFFLAVTLRRRKRAAWILNLVLSGALTAVFAGALALVPECRGHAQNWISLALTALFAGALLHGRREFYAKGDRSNPRRALLTAAGGLLVTSLLAALLVQAADEGPGSSTFAERWSYGLMRAVSMEPARGEFPAISAPAWADALINMASAALFAAVLWAAFRSVRATDPITADDEERLRALLAAHGETDSLGYFALRRDKSVVFSPTGKAAVTYRVVGGVSLASADPLGDPEAWPGAIERWLAEAREHSWTPGVMGASELGGTVYARHGLDALELGDEAVVEIADFSLEGRAMRGVRQAYHRVRRAGYTVRMRRHADIGAEEMARLVRLADDWRDGDTERGFSMALGRLGDPADGDCLMLECMDAEGRLRALLSFVPWGEKGLSLDLMRRDRESDNGLIEFMVLDLIRRADEARITRLSLNFAMFRSVFERGARLGAGPVLRAWRSLLAFFSRWWQIESLYRANAKYRPAWEPRYMLFEKSTDVLRIGLAAARAEGFLTAPGLPKWMNRGRLQRGLDR
ncbi:phosphatidylglycerol lysyltransferase domain-containing protein [Streptomyces mobaraensis]|uniref:phosphatidylglycerol lysyltransferase domain-containing protein n=1 Tax=Streptomyces mobaraensis TaxID=35621 RepID=UPI00333082DC